jgi:hypothetical protein
MPSDDSTVVGNQHWIVESKAFDRCRDLFYLSPAMTSRVSRVGLKRLNRNMLDRWTEGSHAGHQKNCKSSNRS